MMNDSAVNVYIQIFVWTSVSIFLGYIPRSGIAGLHGTSVFTFCRGCHAVFQSGCAILIIAMLVNVKLYLLVVLQFADC